ncbi:MAG: hypothetical protein JWM86_1649 [Thermoleophilia bacterium]|nr:hypothetical protein [Thermoleophilia bacterium]
MARIPDTDRRDVPATFRELYPLARANGRVHVRPPRRSNVTRRTVYLALIAAFAVVVGGALLAALVLPEDVLGHAALIAMVLAVVSPCIGLVAYLLRRTHHVDAWAARRGLIASSARPTDLPGYLQGAMSHEQRSPMAWHAVVGQRRLPVRLAAIRFGGSEDEPVRAAYVAEVRLPPGTAARFPASRLERRARVTPIDWSPAAGQALRLESGRLARECSLVVRDGLELDWRQLFDPALVSLLDEAIDVEWCQVGEELLLLHPVRMSDLGQVDPEVIDTICVAAVAIERRIATMLGAGRAVPPASPRPDSPALLAPGNRSRRYVANARARDLLLGPEQLLGELARYTTAAEVTRVRAAIEAGSFPLSSLDDLVHHRRAAFWGTRDAA